MLSAADQASATAQLTASLPDTCTLLHASAQVSDNAGGSTPTPGSPVSVACRVGPLRLTRSSADAEMAQTGRIVTQSLWLGTLPAGTTITPDWQLVHAGRTFEVVEVLSPRTWELDTRVSLRLLNSGEG